MNKIDITSQEILEKKYSIFYIICNTQWDEYNNGLPLKELPNFILDSKTGKSLVISAKAGSLSKQYMNINAPISTYQKPEKTIRVKHRVNSTTSNLWFDEKESDVFFWLCSASIEEVKSLYRKNPEIKKDIKSAYKKYKRIFFECAVILAEHDSVEISEGWHDLYNCVKVKHGGRELIAEFLTSDFIEQYEEEFGWNSQHKWGDWWTDSEPPGKFEPNGDYYYEKSTTRPVRIDEIYREFSFQFKDEFNPSNHHQVRNFNCNEYVCPMMKFGRNNNLQHLSNEKSFEGEIYHPNYNLNSECFKDLNNIIYAAPLVINLLNEKQLNELHRETDELIFDNIYKIFSQGFRKRLDYYTVSGEVIQDEIKVRQTYDPWGSEMYDILGGDGDNSVYLGDGMSIDRDGDLTDD